MKTIPLIIILIFLFVHIAFSQQAHEVLRPNLGEKVGTCDACGMEVFDRMLTKVAITADGETFYACGMGCAFGMAEGKQVTSMKVVDFTTVSMVEAEDAFFVTGTLLVPVRAMMPLFVFATIDDAEAFVEKYGGTIHDYGGMKELAVRIREERRR
jgi:nitrous oxide reductase accessory protein NosL